MIMAKEVFLYGGIYDYTAEYFMREINSVEEGEDYTIRLNSPGGSVFAGLGIISKTVERKEGMKLKVDGVAASMAFAFVASLDPTQVEANESAMFMVHRASMNVYDETDQKLLDTLNAQMYKNLTKNIDLDAFEAIAGRTLKNIFDSSEVIDVWLTAKQAKKIGLISKVYKLDAATARAKGLAFASAAASYSKKEKEPKQIINKMDKGTLKAEHPAVYAQILAEGEAIGVAKGVKAESERVKTWEVFRATSPEKVTAGLATVFAPSDAQKAEMTLEAALGKKPGTPDENKKPVVAVTETELTAEKKSTAKIDADAQALLDKTFKK